MEKFLIINPFGIGDCLFTTPVISALKERYPGSFIGYWCNERVNDLLKNDPRIDKTFPVSRGDINRVYKGFKKFRVLLNLIREIRKERFDIAFDFSLDSRYGLWSKMAGIRKRIGFNYKNRGKFLTDKIDLVGYSGKHVVEYYLDLLKFLETYRRAHLSVPYSLHVSKENSAKAKSILAEHGIMPPGPVIGIAAGGGASWGKDAFYKQWPAEKFGELAERLIKESSARVVLLGSAEERPLAESVINNMERSRRLNVGYVTDLIGKLNLEELAAIIKELRLLICNDGGPLHMAVSLGVNTVSVFGPVDEKVYGPYPPSEKHVVVKKDIQCRPCYENFRFKGCFNNRRCLEDVTMDEVYSKVKMFL